MIPLPECRAAVASVFSLLGVESRGLDDDGVGLLMLGNMQLGLTWKAPGTLSCDAVVYTFRAPPRAGLMERLQARASAMSLSTGAQVAYVAEHQVLVLRKTYDALAQPAQWLAQWKSLLQDAARFSDEGIGGL